MAKNITVTPEELRNTFRKIKEVAGSYNDTVSSLYSKVDAMSAAWEGKDNMEYVMQIRDFRPHLANMKELMDEYAAFLQNAAGAYDDVQGQVVNRAQSLVN